MSYKVLKAYLGFENIESNPSFNYSFNFSHEITDKFKNYLNQKKAITINSSLFQFGHDIANLATPDIFQKIATDGFDKKKNQLKLIIQMHDNEDNKVDVFVFIRDKGWVIYNHSAQRIESSEDSQQQILITENGYHSIGSGQDLVGMANVLAALFNLNATQTAALIKIATKTGAGTSELAAKAIEYAKNNAPFGIMSDTMEFDYGNKFGPRTQQLQRCLIRFAGGNLDSERKHLSGANYPIESIRWPAGHGPIFPKADSGKYGKETVDVLLQLKPYIDQISNGFIKADAYVVKADILTSPICQGLISDVTDLERKNSKSKTPMGIPSMITQKPPEVVDIPRPAPPAPAPAAAPAVPAVPAVPAINTKFYTSLSEYKAFENFIKQKNDRKLTNFMNEVEKRLQKILSKLKTSKDKTPVKNELINYISELKKETSMIPFVSNEHITKATLLVYAIIDSVEVKTLKESKVYKEYGFLSTKNEKLHSVLMEQLKKDLKRG